MTYSRIQNYSHSFSTCFVIYVCSYCLFKYHRLPNTYILCTRWSECDSHPLADTPDKRDKQTKPMSQSRSGHASAVAHGIIQSPVEIQSRSDGKNNTSESPDS